MDHYFPDIPGLGNVAVSRHAQARMVEDGISEHEFKEALLSGLSVPDGQEVVWREKNGVRVVILRHPTPFQGAMLARLCIAFGRQNASRSEVVLFQNSICRYFIDFARAPGSSVNRSPAGLQTNGGQRD